MKLLEYYETSVIIHLINDYLMKTTTRLKPELICKDGFSMSVQASETHYCDPRQNEGPWCEVEVGYPSAEEPLLFQYAETQGEWTKTVYPYTPIHVLAQVVERHGGIDWDLMKIREIHDE
jgi:hypothetical protein